MTPPGPDSGTGENGKPSMWGILSELKSGIATLNTSAEFIKTDQGAIRQRLHDLSNQLTPLMGIPDQVREVKGQHAELKAQIEKLTAKVETLVPIGDRVSRLEPTVERLNNDSNRGRGAIWMAGALGGLIGVLLAILAAFARVFNVQGH